jgi:hypothetical protein
VTAAAQKAPNGAPSPAEFFAHMVWLDGQPLLDTIEPYRLAILTAVLFSFEAGNRRRRRYNMALCGRAKKNWKSADLVLAALYSLLAWLSDKGNDCYIFANDEGQANDDLSLAKKIILVNPPLAAEVVIREKSIERKDGKGALRILPARDVAGAHGKTFLFCGFDEIHAYRSHDLFEAMALDPSRHDALIWITGYAGIRHTPGIPLFDFMQTGKRGNDPRMFFSWYGRGTGNRKEERPSRRRLSRHAGSRTSPGCCADCRRPAGRRGRGCNRRS